MTVMIAFITFLPDYKNFNCHIIIFDHTNSGKIVLILVTSEYL